MKLVGNILSIVVMVLGIGTWGFVSWVNIYRPMLRRWRFKRSDDALKRLTDHTDYLHDLFGPAVSIRSLTKKDGAYEIYLECPKCKRENRLLKGFVGASCGACKVPFLKPVSPLAPERRPN